MAHYFLGTRLLGASPSRPLWADLQLETHNLVYICPSCGDAWARVMADPAWEWSPVRAGCSLHPWTADIGGTFIHPWLHQFVGLPTEVLLYEFNIRYGALHDNTPR
jgi:hypothetical protein